MWLLLVHFEQWGRNCIWCLCIYWSWDHQCSIKNSYGIRLLSQWTESEKWEAVTGKPKEMKSWRWCGYSGLFLYWGFAPPDHLTHSLQHSLFSFSWGKCLLCQDSQTESCVCSCCTTSHHHPSQALAASMDHGPRTPSTGLHASSSSPEVSSLRGHFLHAGASFSILLLGNLPFLKAPFFPV